MDCVTYFKLLVYSVYLISAAFSQNFRFRLNGAVEGTLVNSARIFKLPSHYTKSPWRYQQTIFADHVGETGILTVSYDRLSESVRLSPILSRVLKLDDPFDYGLTAHLFSSPTGNALDPSTIDVHVLLHGTSEAPATKKLNRTDICVTVAFKSETLQSNSVCSLSWPLDTVCIIGRSLDRRWFIGNNNVNVSFSIYKVSPRNSCSASFKDPDKAKRWYPVAIVSPPSATENPGFDALTSHRSVEMASAEVGNGRPQISLLLPSEDTYFRAGDLLRLPVHLNRGNNLASLLIRVNASQSLQLSEMRLLHPDWRLSIISDNNNRIAVIRATADEMSNSSALLGGPLLEYDFRVTNQILSPPLVTDSNARVRSRRDQRHRVLSGDTLSSSENTDIINENFQLSSASLSWEVEMTSRDSATIGLSTVDSVFQLDTDPITELIPVVKVKRIFNYAILRDSIQRVPLWLYGFTAQAGLVQLWDCECVSSDPTVIKVEPMCRYIYLDGSEGRGSENVTISVKRRRLKAKIHLRVLFPRLPLKIEISDPKLQLIRNFLVPSPKRNGCVPHYQRTGFRIYAKFSYNPALVFHIEADVTEWLRSIVRVANTTVANYDGNSIVGRASGHTMVQLVTAAGQVVGSKPISVSSTHPVSITRLDALIADGINVNITPSRSRSRMYVVADNGIEKLSNLHFFDVTATLRRASSKNIKNDRNKRLIVVAHFTDGSFIDLSTLPSYWYELSIQPSNHADTSVPRVALFEVAKCRKQTVNYLVRTTPSPKNDSSPLSVIRIDGSLLAHKDTQSKSYIKPNFRNPSNSTTVVLATLLVILLIILVILTIFAFRHKIKRFIDDNFGPDNLLFVYSALAYDWVRRQRFTTWFCGRLIPKKKGSNFEMYPPEDLDAESLSCDEEEVGEEVAIEPSSKADKNWVWLSRDTLEQHSVDTMRSHALLPEYTFRSLCCTSRSPALSTTGSNKSRSSAVPLLTNENSVLSSPEAVCDGVSTAMVYTGSECSLRIVPRNPASRYGSATALELVAPDGKLMASAPVTSRTLDPRRKRCGAGLASVDEYNAPSWSTDGGYQSQSPPSREYSSLRQHHYRNRLAEDDLL